jgi:hypothetical protein
VPALLQVLLRAVPLLVPWREQVRLTDEQQRKLDVMIHENSLQSHEDEIRSWIEALLCEGLTFDQALARAELMFCE